MIRPLAVVEKETILEALVECRFSLRKTCLQLDIGTGLLYRRLAEWGLRTPLVPHQVKLALEEIRRVYADDTKGLTNPLSNQGA